MKKIGNKEHASAHFSTQEITILLSLNSSRTHNTNFPPSLAPLLQQRPSGSCSIRYIINLVCSFSFASLSEMLPRDFIRHNFASISGHFPSPTCHLPLRSTCPSMNLQSVTGVSTNPTRSGNSLSTNGGQSKCTRGAISCKGAAKSRSLRVLLPWEPLGRELAFAVIAIWSYHQLCSGYILFNPFYCYTEA